VDPTQASGPEESKMSNILIIDHDNTYRDALDEAIGRLGHHAVWVQTLTDGLERLSEGGFDVVLLQSSLPEGKSVEALPRLLETPSAPEVIMFADTGEPDEAELAIRSGAWDYIERPPSAKGLALALTRVLQYRTKKTHSQPSAPLKQEAFGGVVGGSAAIKACMEVVTLAAHSDANVLIGGETGTGKELFAWAIHNNSPRANRRFVVVDCASLTESLVESTLFGYERGAFTGADRARDGLVKLADGGTLFLDEVGELPLSVQRSFLRVLQERRFRPVGGSQELKSDFRIVAASNRDLDDMVRHGRFRKDLLFRIRAFSLELPPLRERLEDIDELVRYQMAQLCECYGMRKKDFSPEFFEVLKRYSWPGNVRELFNASERAIAAARHEPVLFPKHLPTYIRIELARSSVSGEAAPKDVPQDVTETSKSIPSLKQMRDAAIAEVEQRYVKDLASLTSGDIREACRLSGLSRSRLYYLLKKYSVSISS
jgi:two-component system, NtrC family, response regulator